MNIYSEFGFQDQKFPLNFPVLKWWIYHIITLKIGGHNTNGQLDVVFLNKGSKSDAEIWGINCFKVGGGVEISMSWN